MRLFSTHLVFAVFASSFCAATDWEKKASEAQWEWPHPDPTILSATTSDAPDSPYDIVIHRYSWTAAMERFKNAPETFGCFYDLKVMRDDDVLFQKPAHEGTVFRIRDNRIFFAQFIPSGPGCKVICFDLDAKKAVWKTILRATGIVSHSIYHNRVSLTVLNDSAVQVHGWETNGKYVEYLDISTGKSLAHRLFE